MSYFPFLLVVVLLVALVTVIGHGLWVLFAALVKGPGEPTPGERPLGPGAAKLAACPRCGAAAIDVDRCRACDWPMPPATAVKRPVAALDALARQIEKFRELGILDHQSLVSLSRLIADERQRLIDARLRAVPAETRARQAEIVAAEVADEEFSRAAAAPPIEPPQRVVPTAPLPPAAPVVPVTPAAVRDHREFVSEVPVEVRAAQFATRQESPTQVEVAAESAPPPPPRVAWTDWLGGFMEERNIRWGELVGGLLIVCGSIALVVSFWSEIAQQPLLKFVLFGGVTASLFGTGFYSERRWRLHTTSQGLLIIANLLVPLNFLAIAAFSRTAEESPLLITGEVVSIALFSALVYAGGRILLRHSAIALAAGVLVPSVAQLLVRRWIDPSTSQAVLIALAAVPAMCYLLTNGWVLRRTADRELDEGEVNSLLNFLGITSFAVLLPLGLLVVKTEHVLQTLHRLPLLASVLGIVPLSAGLLVWQKLTEERLLALRLAGTSVGVAGAILSLVGLVLAWPDPAMMLPAALVEFAVFTFVAWRFALPAAHLVAGACLTLSYLLGIYVANGRLPWSSDDPGLVFETLVGGTSGALLVPLALAYAAAAYASRRAGAGGADMLAIVTALVAAASVGLTSWFGFRVAGDPFGAAWVYLVYAAGSLAWAARQKRAAGSWLGAGLLATAVVQGVLYRYAEIWPLAQPWLTAGLLYASACAVIALVVRWSGLAIADSPLGEVMQTVALLTSLAGAAWLTVLVPAESAAFQAGHWFWLAVLWLAVAACARWPAVWTLFQVALSMAAAFGAATRLQDYAWFAESDRPWLDPWTWQAVAAALAGLNLAWVALRLVARRWRAGSSEHTWSTRAAALLDSPWLGVDRYISGGLLAVVAAVGIYAALPGAWQELSPSSTATVAMRATEIERVVPSIERFELFGIPHDHAAEWGSWVLLAAVLALLIGSAWQDRSLRWLLAALVAAAVACPLLASQWEGEFAVASALRWLSVAFAVVASVPMWCRGLFAPQAARLGWQADKSNLEFVPWARGIVLFVAIAPASMIAVDLVSSAASRSVAPAASWSGLYPWIVFLSLITLAVGATAVGLSWSADQTRTSPSRPNWPWFGPTWALVVGGAPILAIAVYNIATALASSPIVGPEPTSIFARMGLAASYAGPLFIVAQVLAVYGIRERSSGFALAGGLMLNLAATVGWLLTMATGGLQFDAAMWIRLAQLNAAVAAVYALAWTGMLWRAARRRGPSEPIAVDLNYSFQVAVAPALVALVLGFSWSDLVWDPEKLGQQLQMSVMTLEVADRNGCGSLLLAAVSVLAATGAAGRRVSIAGITAGLVAVAVLAAVWVSPSDSGDWRSYNTLMVGHGLIAVGLLAVAWREKFRQRVFPADAGPAQGIAAGWIDLQGWIVLVLAARQLFDNRWWSGGAFAALVVLCACQAWVYQRRRYLYEAALLFNVTGTLLGLELKILPDFQSFAYLNVALLAMPVVAWLLIELQSIRRSGLGEGDSPILLPGHRKIGTVPAGSRATPVHRVATYGALIALGSMVAIGLSGDWAQFQGTNLAHGLHWIALASVTLAAVACLWDAAMVDSIALLYFLGLVACGLLVDQFDLPPKWLLWTGNMVVAAYAVATSYLWSLRDTLRAVASRLRIPTRGDHEFAHLSWLVPLNLLLTASVVFLTGIVELTERDTQLRILASQATLAQVVSLALLARGDRRRGLQSSTLQLGAVGAAMFGWAWLEVGTTLTLLHALVVLGAALAVVAALYGFGLVKLLSETSDWLAAARRMTGPLAALSAASIVAALGVEVYEFATHGSVAIAWPAIVVVGVTLVGLAAAALAAAVLPGRDPLGLSERGRTLYVYAAEVALGLLFVHIRVTMPWLFSGFFQQYWPLIVMGIAFLGVGFSELCRRRRQLVLAEPIENTGALLPVLPVLGFWALDSRVDYSLLLATVGMLYAGLSIARRSFGFGVLAALAANGGLWYFLQQQQGFGFLMHPQIWLIPPALCVLAAAYLNRRQLGNGQMTAIRYMTSVAIYVSSTADIFINGVAQNPWLPLVLAGLSILGILAGILLRVRAFLFLGTSFLGLALFTIIWHAAVDLDQTWIWYATVVVTGILIIALFATFEKKRQEMLEVLEKLKQWEA